MEVSDHLVLNKKFYVYMCTLYDGYSGMLEFKEFETIQASRSFPYTQNPLLFHRRQRESDTVIATFLSALPHRQDENNVTDKYYSALSSQIDVPRMSVWWASC
jgi:hypothetical protein